MTAIRSRWAVFARRGAGTLLAMVFAAYAAVSLWVYFKQESLIFRPVPLALDHRFPFDNIREVSIPVAGALLSAVHLKFNDPKGVVFFLHGNSGNLKSWLTNTEFYRHANYDLFMIDYRGFGKSTGQIDGEEQLHTDVRAAWDTIAAEYKGKKIVVYGRSLGTGLAAKLASDIQPDLTVLVSPYESLKALGDRAYPWLPAFINRYTMRTDRWLPEIKNAVVIEHGDRDTLIPIAHAQALMRARPTSELIVVENAGHNDIHKFQKYLDTLTARLTNL